MAPKEVQRVCVALCAIGLTGVITCCALPRWVVVRDYTEPDMDYHNSLWKKCVTHRTGLQECYMYDELSAQLEAFRAMTVISCILCGLSLLLLILGSDLTTYVQNQNIKPKMILASAVGLLLAGLLVIVPVSWVAHDMAYVSSLYEQKERKIGASIFIGWETGVLMILTGVLICYASRPRSSSSGGTARYRSNRASVTYDDVM